MALAKPSRGIQPIVVGEILYQLVNKALCLQFQDMFTTHFSTYQFGVVVRGGCKMVVHGVGVVLNIHVDWVFYRWMLQMPLTPFLGKLFSKSFVQ